MSISRLLSRFLTCAAVFMTTPLPLFAVEKASEQVSPFMGSFSYSVAIDVPAFHGLEPRALSYDGNGNLVAGRGRSITWNADSSSKMDIGSGGISVASDQTSQQRTLNEIDRRLGAIDLVRVDQPTYVKLALPAARGADFHFNVYVYDDGEPQITAQPRIGGGDAHDLRDRVAFWCLSFEAPDFRSDDERLNAFLAVLDCLLTHDVRIRQRRGWLSYSFACEYQADDRWIALPRVSYLRWTLRPAAPQAGALCFSSPPLLPAAG